jgi:hypothetical protein
LSSGVDRSGTSQGLQAGQRGLLALGVLVTLVY